VFWRRTCIIFVCFNVQDILCVADCLKLNSMCIEENKNNIVTTLFLLRLLPLYVATFKQHLHMEYISLSCCHIPALVVPIRISLIEGSC
jgi:hypothetical protein